MLLLCGADTLLLVKPSSLARLCHHDRRPAPASDQSISEYIQPLNNEADEAGWTYLSVNWIEMPDRPGLSRSEDDPLPC